MTARRRVAAPPPTTPPGPTTPTTPAPPTTITPTPITGRFVVVGDIASCNLTTDEQVAELVVARPDRTFWALGDFTYGDNTINDFNQCYDPAFGSARARTLPVVGNHEYGNPFANGYFTYFAGITAPPGYSAQRVGNWLVLVLNSNCSVGHGCAPGEAMYQFVQQQLAANPTSCIAAAWHHAPYSSEGGYTRDRAMDPILSLLAANGLDVLLAGHAHSYERFARLDAQGRPSATGYRLFVVGTGGITLRPSNPQPWPGSEARNTTDHGVMELNLRNGGYDWSFVPIAGRTFTDAGSDTC
jgi:hypothetical protein